MNNNTNTKQSYIAPTLKVVEFKVELGFANSNGRGLLSFGFNPPAGGNGIEPYGGDPGKGGPLSWNGWNRLGNSGSGSGSGNGSGNGNSYF